MKLNAYSIYDSKAKAFSQPFFTANHQIAERSFSALVSEKGTNNVAKFPEDFSLHYIGQFDDETGELVSNQHENLGLASQFKIQE